FHLPFARSVSRRVKYATPAYKRFKHYFATVPSGLHSWSSLATVPPRAAPAMQAAQPQPPVLSVPCGADLRPAGGRQGVRRGVGGPAPARGGRGGRWKRPFNFPIPDIEHDS